ncbi:uncharacterized protein LOC114800887 isoform X2 [Denticeps clupeoides]|nr:uncharacterized protein C20orf96 homolog isoform X2 [Denticeps clupeoides]
MNKKLAKSEDTLTMNNLATILQCIREDFRTLDYGPWARCSRPMALNVKDRKSVLLKSARPSKQVARSVGKSGNASQATSRLPPINKSAGKSQLRTTVAAELVSKCCKRNQIHSGEQDSHSMKTKPNRHTLAKAKTINLSMSSPKQSPASASDASTEAEDSDEKMQTTNSAQSHISAPRSAPLGSISTDKSECSDHLTVRAEDSGHIFSKGHQQLEGGCRVLSGEQDFVSIEKLLVECRRKSLTEMELYCEKLMVENLLLTQEIESASDPRQFVTEHQRFRTTFAAIKEWGQHQINKANAELKALEEAAAKRISGIQEELAVLNRKIQRYQEEFDTLRTYMSKEHPVEVRRISATKSKMEKMKAKHENDCADVSQIFLDERDRLQRRYHQEEQDIQAAMSKILSRIPPKVKRMAFGNQVMKAEIELCKKEIFLLEEKNKDLICSVRELELSRTSVRELLLQHGLSKMPKCAPDMEVVLNAPQEEQLPI